MQTREQLERELQRAEKVVASWPQWKQDAMKREAARVSHTTYILADASKPPPRRDGGDRS
jgi:hypothetical protein